MAHLGSLARHGGTITTGSPDTFGGSSFGDAKTNAIIDFAKLGAIRPDDSVDDWLMAELLADHLRIKVRTFIRRSDYKNTWESFEERQLGKLCDTVITRRLV